MPVMHVSDIINDRAGLLYAIKMKKSIDIGSVIQQSILQYVKTPKAGLYCAFLITVMCHKAGVPYDSNE